ncbi:interleukin-15 receptor subunit alpha isoform X1 [Garra rufa]|uniref:interleukin-15 receptor subunit alpha isoform X1 n=1 Tax=Garra rufa TaxID=137080 RepID=UPI003CCE789D
MHMLVKLFFITAACQHNIVRASGVCGKLDVPYNTKPVPDFTDRIGASIRFECADGYVRRAGTSSLIRCIEKNGKISWHSDLRLQCIPDPKRPVVPKSETQTPHQHFTSSTTERTTRMNTTVHGTIKPTTATGHIALTTTNEVVRTKTRRTTSQSTLMSTTKEAESITTNEITSSTSSNFISTEYMTTTTTTTTTTTSSHTLSSSFTPTTGANVSMRTSTVSKGNGTVEARSSDYKSTVGGVAGILLICLVAAVFILWWRSRTRRTNRNKSRNLVTFYTPVPQNSAADRSTENSESDNQPQIGMASGADT